MSRTPCLMLVAGEASGDALGADLICALRERHGEGAIRMVGIGGPAMAAQGIASPFDIAQLSVIGLFEGLKAWPTVRARVADSLRFALEHRPDVVVLIDSWGFTLRVARALRKALPQAKLIKYVAPQVWASRPGRAATLAGCVDHLISIQPLDLPYFEGVGLPTTLVGNPVVGRGMSRANPDLYRQAAGLEAQAPVLTVLPGSRPAEIARMMPVFRDTVARVARRFPDIHLALPVAGTVKDAVRLAIADWPVAVALVEDDALKTSLLRAATVALACSGTVTTELALAGCPMVVGYKMSDASYAILRHLFRPDWITMLSITAGREIVPEYMQDHCTADNLERELCRLLADPQARQAQIAAQGEALQAMGLGLGDPSARAAEVVAGFLFPH